MANRTGNVLHPSTRQSPRDDAFAALRAAHFHLCQLKAQIDADLRTQKEVDLLHWHLRGFFWEIVAVRDSLKRAAKNDKTIRLALDSLANQQWFKEVNAYRNFAHESFHVVEAVRSMHTNKLAAVTLNRAHRSQSGRITIDELTVQYWEEMKRFLTVLFSPEAKR